MQLLSKNFLEAYGGVETVHRAPCGLDRQAKDREGQWGLFCDKRDMVSLSLGGSTPAPGNLELSPRFGPDLLHYLRHLLQQSGLYFPLGNMET